MATGWKRGIDDPLYPSRTWACSGQVGSKLYIFAGLEGTTLNRIYDMAIGSWSSGAVLSSGIQQPPLQAPAIGNKLYVAGGAGFGAGAMRVYDAVANTWTNYAGGTSNTFTCSVAVGTDIYVLGGWPSGRHFFKFNTLTNTWSTLTNLPWLNTFMASVIQIDNDNFRLFGSTYGTGVSLNDWGLTYNYNYKISTATWDTSTYAQIPVELDNPYIAGASGPKIVGEGGASVIRVEDNIYVIGGTYTTVQGNKNTRIYNITTDTWSSGPQKPSGAALGAIGFYQDKIYQYNAGMEIYQFKMEQSPIIAIEAGEKKNTLTWTH